ncbi:complex I subunit 5 family protein [Halomonas dongshanensis]|uniref:Complex I subunit 5 family protein n=1 Tax=Halomonas dongshanensis TaxID=2890835 RepID=A0ABT2EG63_9GAMM|nr:complex I subunit 5 family protein [Halomonas dongshanensis]MCS2609622.1 complex I subunit 5 family protein [Halomonas dongshanensis]
MTTLLFVLALLWPLAVAALTLAARLSPRPEKAPGVASDLSLRFSRVFRPFSWLWVSASWPALLLAVSGEARWQWEGFMLGGLWELTPLTRPWLLFTALLWTLAAVHAKGYFKGDLTADFKDETLPERSASAEKRRGTFVLALFWPLAFAGNALLILAQDIASFYFGFALMTFAAYPLVVQAATQEAWRGGRVYLILAVMGEAFILAGLLWAAGAAETLTLSGVREGIASADAGIWMALLLFVGFGVKAGVVGLHVWLPLAHPVAPAPASAVLSGAMIKAGLLGWINVLPLGDVSTQGGLVALGQGILAVGLIAAFAAALYGVWQRHPKAVLAYSSISQMGMLTALVGVGLVTPEVWSLLWPAVALFAAHHALAKGALFLGTSISEHSPRWPVPLLWALLALPGLSLTGALAAGMVSKWSFKSALYEAEHALLIKLLTFAAIGTAALMSVALWRQWQRRQVGGSDGYQQGGWLLALAAALTAPLWLPLPQASPVPPLKEWWGLVWPLLAGVFMVACAVALLHRRRGRLPPAGDAWWLYAVAARALYRPLAQVGERLARMKQACVELALKWERRAMAAVQRCLFAEAWLRHHVGGLMMALALVLAALLMWEGGDFWPGR